MEVLCRGNKVECAPYEPPYGTYRFEEISSFTFLREGSISKSGALLYIYNRKNKKGLYIKPKSTSINDIVKACKEAESHVWPILGIEMRPRGLKCNYWDRGFRIEVAKVKDYYRVRLFKHQLVEDNYMKRRKPRSYKTDYEGLKSIILEAKLSIL